MNEEKMRILKMVESGKISAEEAAELLQSIGSEPVGNESGEMKASSLKGRKIRIRVTDIETGKKKVNIGIPLRLAKFAEIMIPKDAKSEMKDNGIDLTNLLADITDSTDGPLIDIDTDEGEEKVHIEIYVE